MAKCLAGFNYMLPIHLIDIKYVRYFQQLFYVLNLCLLWLYSKQCGGCSGGCMLVPMGVILCVLAINILT